MWYNVIKSFTALPCRRHWRWRKFRTAKKLHGRWVPPPPFRFFFFSIWPTITTKAMGLDREKQHFGILWKRGDIRIERFERYTFNSFLVPIPLNRFFSTCNKTLGFHPWQHSLLTAKRFHCCNWRTFQWRVSYIIFAVLRMYFLHYLQYFLHFLFVCWHYITSHSCYSPEQGCSMYK